MLPYYKHYEHKSGQSFSLLDNRIASWLLRWRMWLAGWQRVPQSQMQATLDYYTNPANFKEASGENV
jgi:hypothetical protein